MLRLPLFVLLSLVSTRAGAANVVEIWNPALCGYTSSSRFELTRPLKTATVVVWIDWRDLGTSTAYTLSAGGKELQSGNLSRGSCDPYQPNWCEGRLPGPFALAPGKYRIDVPAARICQNDATGGAGFVRVSDGVAAGAGYVGCYRDTGDRDIGPETFAHGAMTTERCLAHCAGKGFAYAATQFANHCFCGNAYGRFGTATNCDMKCSGNVAQICGGSWANSVYKIDGGASASAPVPPPTTTAGDAALGCYRDTGDRDIGPETFADSAMTTERCLAHCAAKGFKYAATQFANHCFCGNAYGRFGTATNCDMKCGGNAAQTCGGSWANQVYRTGK